MQNQKERINDTQPGLRDFGSVNALYAKYRKEGDQDALRLVQIWAYDWVMAFYTELYMRGDIREPSMMDKMVTKAYFTFLNKHHKVDDPRILTGWLSKVCGHIAIDYYRQNRIVFIDDETRLDTAVEFDDYLENQIQTGNNVRAVIKDLRDVFSENSVRILEYKWIENMSIDEIAGRTGLSSQTVKNKYSLALKKIIKSDILKKRILKLIYGD